MKKLVWLVDSQSSLKTFPSSVQDDIGFALYLAQVGDTHTNAKPLRGFGSGVMEIAALDRSGTYRAVYTVSIGDSIYVVQVFQKKSKVGIATPKPEMELLRRRLNQLRNELKHAKENS